MACHHTIPSHHATHTQSLAALKLGWVTKLRGRGVNYSVINNWLNRQKESNNSPVSINTVTPESGNVHAKERIHRILHQEFSSDREKNVSKLRGLTRYWINPPAAVTNAPAWMDWLGLSKRASPLRLHQLFLRRRLKTVTIQLSVMLKRPRTTCHLELNISCVDHCGLGLGSKHLSENVMRSQCSISPCRSIIRGHPSVAAKSKAPVKACGANLFFINTSL